MKQMKSKKKYKTWFEEVCAGLQKVRMIGRTSVVTIPKKILQEHSIKIGSEILVVLLIRKRKVIGESNEEETWVKMSKKDAIRFQFFCEQDNELNSIEVLKSPE